MDWSPFGRYDGWIVEKIQAIAVTLKLTEDGVAWEGWWINHGVAKVKWGTESNGKQIAVKYERRSKRSERNRLNIELFRELNLRSDHLVHHYICWNDTRLAFTLMELCEGTALQCSAYCCKNGLLIF